MAKFTFNMPDIGEGIAEAEIVQWHKQVGDTVSEDEEFVDMMTDKATVPMESPVNGKILEIAGGEGDMSRSRTPIPATPTMRWQPIRRRRPHRHLLRRPLRHTHRPHLRQRFSPAPRCASARRNWASIWVR